MLRVKVKKDNAEATIKILEDKGYIVTREKNVLLVDTTDENLYWEFYDLEL